jgi:cell division protein FtsB
MAYNITKPSSSSTIKKILFFLAIATCLVVINGLVRSIYDLWHKQDLVVKAQKNLEEERKENKRLKSQLKYVASNQFIEEEARNKLFMVKPGESGVIIPSSLIQKKEEKVIVVLPNWQKWINLFVGR